jgi:ribosomal protein S18 acetylase RimI-like enzyme
MIQLARPQDRAEVSRLSLQIHDMHVAWRPDIYMAVQERFPQEYFDRVVQARELYVAVLNGQVVGYVLVGFRKADWPGIVPRKIMCIDEFCVDEAMRRQGIGTQMLTEIKVLAKAFGCTDLQLSVYPQNDEAVGFYQKNGLMIQDIKMQMKL